MSLTRDRRLHPGYMAICVCLSMVAGCGDDANKEPAATAPDFTANQVLLAEMEVALEKSVALIFTGGGRVPGSGGGQVLVEGTSFIFQQYSPDGELVIDGQLDLNVLASPVTLKGTIQLAGSMEFEVLVDMTINILDEPISYGGTLIVDGEVFDVAEIEQEVSS